MSGIYPCILLLVSAIAAGAHGAKLRDGAKARPPALHIAPATLSDIAPEKYRELSLDQLIVRLPDTDAEGQFDEEQQEWIYHPAVLEMRRRVIRNPQMDAGQWQQALQRSGVFRLRDKWPVDMAILVDVNEPHWLSLCELRLHPRNPKLEPLQVGDMYPGGCFGSFVPNEVALGKLPVGHHRLIFDAELERGPLAFMEDAARLLWQGDLAFDIEIVPHLHDVLPPMNTPELDQAIRAALGAFSRHSCPDRGPILHVAFDANVQATPELATMAVSGNLELVRDGEIRARTPLFVERRDQGPASNSAYGGPIQLIAWATFAEFPIDQIDNAHELRHWTLRLQGGAERVLESWHARTHWNGAIELPLSEALAREKERMAGKEERTMIGFGW